MTDATPVNRYLLFNSPDEFRTHDKVEYALHKGGIFHHSSGAPNLVSVDVGSSNSRTEYNSNRNLVRTLDELKRSLYDRGVPVSPSTENTYAASGGPSAFPSPEAQLNEFPATADCSPAHSTHFMDSIPLHVNDMNELDEHPWDSPASQASYWSWPIETLYQRYHLVVTIDFGKSAYNVSRNGVVYADRIPSVVSALLNVIETTLRARSEAVIAIKHWLDTNVMEPATRAQIMQQVWDPTMCVSMVLLNTPRQGQGAVPFAMPPQASCGRSGRCTVGASDNATLPPVHPYATSDAHTGVADSVVFFPPDHIRFSPFTTQDDEKDEDVDGCFGISILTRSDARALLNDENFVEQLSATLAMYESVCRERTLADWPESSISKSLEYLVRTAPESAAECTTVVVIDNISPSTVCSDTLSFLESVVRRKNIIISVVALNRTLSFDSPQLSPLSQFISSVGGFAVHVDYWLALAAVRLNREWCHRFEGARCLAQQLFVQLVSSFPVCSYGISQHAVLTEGSGELGSGVPLYAGNQDFLRDFTFNGTALSLLRSMAIARFNEGWSVLLDYLNESTAGHLVARTQHSFHRGTLTFQYEMDVNKPVVYRRLLISGTKALVEHFCRIRCEEYSTASAQTDSGAGSWLAYLTLLRLQLHAWVKAEEVALRLLSSAVLNGNSNVALIAPELPTLSGFSGVMSEWLSVATVTSFGVFFQYDPLPSVLTMNRTSSWAIQAVSSTTTARECIRAAMLQQHQPVVMSVNSPVSVANTDGDGMAFMSLLSKPGCVAYVVQFFDFQTGTAAGLAGGFECRVSFIACDAASQAKIVTQLISVIKDASSEPQQQQQGTSGSTSVVTGSGGLQRGKRVVIRCSTSLANLQALLLCMVTVAPRRLELLACHSEALMGISAGTRGVVPGSASRKSLQPQQQQAVIKGPWATLQRCMRNPYVVFPWVLASALSFRWTFATLEPTNNGINGGGPGGAAGPDAYVAEVFNLAVMRRLRNGYRLLMCYSTALKAVLHLTRGLPSGLTVNLFDVVEVQSAASGSSSGGDVVHISRLITPHSLINTSLWDWMCDVQEDWHIATTLHTYRIFSTQVSMVERRVHVHALRHAGMTPITARVESMLPYLTSTHTQVLELHSPSTLAAGEPSTFHSRRRKKEASAASGNLGLRVKLVQLLSAMSDCCAVVRADALHSSYAQILSSGSAPLPRNARVQVAIMFPLRNQTITLMLSLLEDTPEGTKTGVVKVAIASLNRALLQYGLLRQYSRGVTVPDEAHQPDCPPDRDVVHAVCHMLNTFSSVYTTYGLVSLLNPRRGAGRRGGAAHAATHKDEETIVRDIKEGFGFLSTYVAEVDITYLLSVVEGRYGSQRVNNNAQGDYQMLKNILTELFEDLAVGFPSSAPTLLLSLHRIAHRSSSKFSSSYQHVDGVAVAAGSSSNEDTVSSSDSSDGDTLHTTQATDSLPLLMKVQAVVLTQSNEVECGFWISARSCFENNPRKEKETRWLEDNAEWSAESLQNESETSRRLVLRVFVKTTAPDMFDLFKDACFTPSSEVVRTVMRSLIVKFSSLEAATYNNSSTSASARVFSAGALQSFSSQDLGEPIFLDDTLSLKKTEQCRALCHDFGAFPDRIRSAVMGIVSRWTTHLASYTLECAFLCFSYTALRTLVSSEGSPSQDAGVVARTMKSSSDTAVIAEAGTRSYFLHSSASISSAAAGIMGLHSLLHRVVSPALLSSNSFVRVEFPVLFTQQATNYRTVNPIEAALDVFRRCEEEDCMCVVRTAEFMYTFVPYGVYFDRRWLLVAGDIHAGEAAQNNKARILGYGSKGLSTMCNCLCAHIHKKIAQVSQLHLLRQLRESQYASAELIPDFWGDQFCSSNSGSSSGGQIASQGTSKMATVLTSNAKDDTLDSSTPAFYLRGFSVLEIPIYYKLQHQCKKILTRITTNSSRLELFNVFNREQCYVVADDEERDIFHYLRLVFVKDIFTTISTTVPSPPVMPSNRCPLLVVQLFCATANPIIARPLQKLQDFCYLLAVQELQGHLNYVQHKMISFNDLVFLQNNRLETLTLDSAEILPPTLCEPGSGESATQLAVMMLFINLRENKFKQFDVHSDQAHATSNFVEHYSLEKDPREEAGAAAATADGSSGKDVDLSASATAAAAAGAAATTLSGHAASTAETDGRVLRFVKVVDGVTDVLVSCAIRFRTGSTRIDVEQYLTRIPAERYINGESEQGTLAELREHVADTRAQLSFYGLSAASQLPENVLGAAGTQSSEALTATAVPHLVDELMATCATLSTRENLILRHHTFPLDEMGPALLPILIERLCGALSPLAPRCFQSPCEGANAHALWHFPWIWKERLQNDPLADQNVFYITCGYRIMGESASGNYAEETEEAESPKDTECRKKQAEVSATRTIPFSHPDLPISTTTVEEAHAGLLRECGLVPSSGAAAPGSYVVVKLSLLEGMSLAMFNLRDANFLMRLLAYVVSELVEKSSLLDEILLQRLGYGIPSSFTEVGLALHCCGDTRNVIRIKPLSIHADYYRRRVNHAHFRARNHAQDDLLTIMMEGLYNRGLVVNYSFAMEDGVKALFDECPHLSLAQCEKTLQDLIESGALVLDTSSALVAQRPLAHVMGGGAAPGKELPGVPRGRTRHYGNCRLAETSGAPADALIACDYHRHVLAAHVIAEAQNARSGVAEVLSRCDELWRSLADGTALTRELTTCIVSLQMKSKEVFGARVPDFFLRREQGISSEDEKLDSTLPELARQSPGYCIGVNESLKAYMMRLRAQFPGMCVIEVDPNDPQYRADPVVASRLCCRYGKVVVPDTNATGGEASEDAVLFCPHLYYGVMPLVDLVQRNEHMHARYEGAFAACASGDPQSLLQSPIASTGLLIVEVGLQVVHFALDLFVINGKSLPPGLTAQVAADFKHQLMFDSVLYDVSVLRFVERIHRFADVLPAQQRLSTAVANLVKYHPTPPFGSVNMAATFRVTDPRIMRLKNLPPSPSLPGRTEQQQLYQLGSGEMLLLPPTSKPTLRRERTGEVYSYCGVIVWESAQLLVLLASVMPCGAGSLLHSMAACSSTTSGADHTYMAQLTEHARQLLLSQLFDSTQQERLHAAWDKVLSEPATGPVLLPSYDEMELLRQHSYRVHLDTQQYPLLLAVETAVWSTDEDACALYKVQQRLFPHHVVRVIWKKRGTSMGAMPGAPMTSSVSQAVGHASSGGASSSAMNVAVGGPSSLTTAVSAGLSAAKDASSGAGALYDKKLDGHRLSSHVDFASLPERVIFTFAPHNRDGSVFIAMECVYCDTTDMPLAVEDVSLYYKAGSPAALAAAVTVSATQEPLDAFSPTVYSAPPLPSSAQETDLVEKFLALVINTMWASIVPCASAFDEG